MSAVPDARAITVIHPGGPTVRLVRMVAYDPPPLGGIGARDRRVLAAACRCGSDEETAEELGVALKTVKNRLTAIRRAMGVRRTSQACYALGVETERRWHS